MRILYILTAAALLLASCKPSATALDEEVQTTAADFAQAYFNYDYESALKLATPESEKWLRYAASNVTQAVVDLYNAQQEGVVVAIDDFYWTNDTMASVSVSVSNFVVDDSIHSAPRIADEGLFRLTLVRRDGKLAVRMAGPLRNETQSRD